MNYSRKKALVVEEDHAVGRLLYKALLAEGFDVRVATDGKTALEALNEARYDILISDLAMVCDSEMLFYHYLKSYYPDLFIRTIFTFIPIPGDSLQELVKNHMGYFLSKPFTLQELKELVASVCKNRLTDLP